MATSEDRTGMARVSLSQTEWEQRSELLAKEELALKDLREIKRTKVSEWNEQLKQTKARIEQLATEVDTHEAWVPAQAIMFGGDDDGTEGLSEADGEEPPEPEPEAPKRGRRRRGAAAAAANNNADTLAS
jgi:hypothetical protein